MEIHELFRGIAIVIDNEIGNDKASISYIIAQIKQQNIPYIPYKTIPTDEEVINFCNLSFVLLDWDLNEIDDRSKAEGVKAPATLSDSLINENIHFITTLKGICYCPIFIFSDLNVNAIALKLEENHLILKGRPNHIFIKSKGDLQGDKLFNEIEKWVKINPSIYVLKEWEKEYQKSKNNLFLEFQELSPIWPKILWKNYEDDGVNKSLELGELITRNLLSRMMPFEFCDEILTNNAESISQSEIRKVLEGCIYIGKEKLHDDNIAPGDVFQISNEYFVNIRAACNLIPDRNKPKASLDDVELYLLKGQVVSEKDITKLFLKEYGIFSEADYQAILFPIINGKILDFHFKKIFVKDWRDIKQNRIGRILPPFITKIQQKYAHYLQRQGLPRTPSEALFTPEEIVKTTE